MLTKYGKLRYAICTFQGVTPLISSIRTETQDVKDSNISKEALESKQTGMGSQI